MGNYRPVSLISVVGKVLETLIRDQMRNHLYKYKLIKGGQHGFTKGSSCLTNLSEFHEAVSDWVDEGKVALIHGMVLLSQVRYRSMRWSSTSAAGSGHSIPRL